MKRRARKRNGAVASRSLRVEALEHRNLLSSNAATTAWEKALVVDSNGTLWAVDTSSAYTSRPLGGTGRIMLDVAFDTSGQLFGVASSGLYQINVSEYNGNINPNPTVSSVFLGQIRADDGAAVNLEALEFDDQNRLYAAGNYAPTGRDWLYEVDEDPDSGELVAQRLRELSIDDDGDGQPDRYFEVAGDLDLSPTAAICVTTEEGELLRLTSQSKDYSSLAVVGNTGRGDLYGLMYLASPGRLVGFGPKNAYGQNLIYRISLDNGSLTQLATLVNPTRVIYGAAAVSKYVLPDLVPHSLDAQPDPEVPIVAGGTFDVSFSVANLRARSASNFKVGFYLSRDETLDAGDVALGVYSLGGLGANGNTGLLTTTLTAPAYTHALWNGNGTYHVIMVVDVHNQVIETEEDNNTACADVVVEMPKDYGDAPAPYPTLAADDGARHDLLRGGPFLGAAVDGEADGRPDPDARGDDHHGVDDEDGVTFLDPLIPGQPARVRVDMSHSPVGGRLTGWIDFNRDGDWADAGEKIIHDRAMAAGEVATVQFTVPATAIPGATYARFRISTEAGLGYDGLAPDGEVEDYQVAVAASDVGTVAWQKLTGQTPVSGGLGYLVTPARNGFLTAVLLAGAGAQTTMRLYRFDSDGSIRVVDVGDLRVDNAASVAGTEYFLEVKNLASNADLLFANLVRQVGNNVTVHGTDGGDAFAARHQASGVPEISINGLLYDSSLLSGFSYLAFDGGPGDNSASLTGSAGRDLIEIRPDGARVEAPGLTIDVNACRQIDVDGAGGDDEAWLDGTGVAGGYLRLWPLYGTWTAAGEPFNHTLANVATVHALADGGDDTAALYDSKGDDVFYGGPTSPHGTRFVGTTPGRVFDNEVVGYANVYAYARAGGNDAAELYDSNTSADSFFGKPGDGTFYGPEFYLRAIGFERVNAHASDDGFADAARLYDSDGDDTFYAGPTSPEGTTMAGTTAAGWSYANAVSGFRYVTGYSENGGADVAHLYDSDASRDYYVAKQEYVTLYGSTFSSTVLGFDDVRGYASDDGFNDTAFLNDSDGDDTFDAGPRSPEGTRLSGTTLGGRTYSFAVEGFRAVSAFATAGGSDRAEMYDSDTSRDVFVGAPGDSTIKGPDFTCRAVGFHEVSAYASPNDGFDDVAQLYDSDGDDVFYAGPTSPEGTKLVGTTLAGWTFSNSADGFRYVYGYAKAGGNDVAEFYDAAGSDDAFVGKPAYGVLYGPEFQLRASLFEQVNVYASDPGDRAKLYDSDGDDAFHAGPSSPVGTRLSGTTLAGHGFAHTLAGFYYVNAYAYAGGSDRAYLYGSAGAVDYLSASLEGRYAKFYDGMSYRVHAERFERYEVRGTPGDNDQASLFDSSGNDHVEGDATIDPALAVLIGAGQRYDLYDFGRVKVTGSTGTDTKHVVAALDYVLQTVGTWIDV